MDVRLGPRAGLLLEREQAPDRKRCSTGQLTLAVGMLMLCLVALCLLLGNNAISRGFALQEISSPGGKKSDIVNVLFVGDWGRKGLYNQSAVAEQMGVVGAEMSSDFIVSVGDNFYEDGLTGANDSAFTESFSQIYTAESLQKTWHVSKFLFHLPALLKVPFDFPRRLVNFVHFLDSVLGNHDYRGDVLAQLDPELRLKDSRWHCERFFTLSRELTTSEGDGGYVDFFFYDTNPFVQKYWNDTEHSYDWRGVEPKEEYLRKQQEFLSTGLETSNATWKIVIGHHPIRSVGEHGNTVELEDQIYPILQANDVDLYVNGHDHCLEHITEGGIEFLTTGGGSKAWRGIDSSADMTGLQFYYDGQGFMSLQISANYIHFSFYDVLGNTLHKGHLSKNAA